MSDSQGGVYNAHGLDAGDVLHHKRETGSVVGYPDADDVTNQELLELPCDMLVPAAVENQITASNANAIRAKIIAEGANGRRRRRLRAGWPRNAVSRWRRYRAPASVAELPKKTCRRISKSTMKSRRQKNGCRVSQRPLRPPRRRIRRVSLASRCHVGRRQRRHEPSTAGVKSAFLCRAGVKRSRAGCWKLRKALLCSPPSMT